MTGYREEPRQPNERNLCTGGDNPVWRFQNTGGPLCWGRQGQTSSRSNGLKSV